MDHRVAVVVAAAVLVRKIGFPTPKTGHLIGMEGQRSKEELVGGKQECCS